MVERGTCVAAAPDMTRLALLAIVLSGCVVGDDPVDPPDETLVEPDITGSPDQVNIGFNDGHAEEFDYYDDFFNASAIHPGPRLCHAYFAWDVGLQAPHSGSVTDQGARAFVDDWFARAQGHCQDALI